MANAELATAWIRLQPSFQGVKQSISKEIDGVPTDKYGQQAGNRFTGGVSKGVAKLGAAVAAGFAVKKVADFFTTSLDAVKNWQVLNAQTEAVVKSTGGAANVTAKQVHDLANALEATTATEAELVQEGANMLLTFKNIQNRVGEGNDIFNQATEALIDMSRAMGSDPQTAAIQLGKALNDPITGISALQRVGIQFTEDQKKVIESLVETGDVAGAQKIIIEELNDQFGGSGQAYAETYVGKLELLRAAFEGIGEDIVTKLMPHLDDLITWLNEDGIEAVEDFAAGMSDIFANIQEVSEQDWYRDFVTSLDTGGELDLVGGGFVDNFKKKWAELPQSFANGWEQIKEGNRVASDEIGTQFEQSVADWAAKFDNGRTQINEGVYWLWGQIGSYFENGTKLSGERWDSMWSSISEGTATASFNVATAVGSWWSGLMGSFRNGWQQITGAFSNGWQQISTFMGRVGEVVDGAKRKFEEAGQGIRDAFRGIGQFLKDAFGPVADLVGGAGNWFKTLFGGAGDRARHIKGQATTAASNVGGGGAALSRVQATLPAGLRVTDTLSNPVRDRLLGLNRSVNSYHYDRNNPAVDIAGPTWLLHQYAAKLRAMGGWRQLLWQVPGHYDHIHVAHSGGVVDSSWYRSPGDKWDERTVRLQVGETVLPKGVSPVNASYEVEPAGRPIYVQNPFTGEYLLARVADTARTEVASAQRDQRVALESGRRR